MLCVFNLLSCLVRILLKFMFMVPRGDSGIYGSKFIVTYLFIDILQTLFCILAAPLLPALRNVTLKVIHFSHFPRKLSPLVLGENQHKYSISHFTG